MCLLIATLCQIFYPMWRHRVKAEFSSSVNAQTDSTRHLIQVNYVLIWLKQPINVNVHFQHLFSEDTWLEEYIYIYICHRYTVCHSCCAPSRCIKRWVNLQSAYKQMSMASGRHFTWSKGKETSSCSHWLCCSCAVISFPLSHHGKTTFLCHTRLL